jgi:hypothetical protein
MCGSEWKGREKKGSEACEMCISWLAMRRCWGLCVNDGIGWFWRCMVQVMDFLGSAAFSQAVQALDTASGALVCLKIIKNNKVGDQQQQRRQWC